MPFEPEYTRSDPKVVGVWRIDTWRLSSPQANFKLKEIKSALGKVPVAVFESDDFPNAGKRTIGKSIPVGFGVVEGARAFPVNTETFLFKVVGHSVESFQAFYNEDDEEFTPDSIDLGNGEFTYIGWNGTDALFADFTAEGENPIDCIKLLLIDSVKGANTPLADIDTTSTGNKGFGVNGARNEYIYGTSPFAGGESVEFPIGLYIDRARDVTKWIQQVAAASFALVYVDLSGLYQIKAWKPEVSEDLDVITDANIIGTPSTEIIGSNVITKVISKYSENHGLGEFQTVSHTDDRIRQLRGLTQHKVLEEEIALSNRFGAKYWAERTVAMRGVPRRMVVLNTTQEFMLKEPGDYVRLQSNRYNIDEVWEVVSITINPGTLRVSLKLIDVRGFREKEGFWTPDSLSFPDSLGGATITQWDNTWTDAQKKWAKENFGFWCGDEDYIDAIDDPRTTYRGSVWV